MRNTHRTLTRETFNNNSILRRQLLNRKSDQRRQLRHEHHRRTTLTQRERPWGGVRHVGGSGTLRRLFLTTQPAFSSNSTFVTELRGHLSTIRCLGRRRRTYVEHCHCTVLTTFILNVILNKNTVTLVLTVPTRRPLFSFNIRGTLLMTLKRCSQCTTLILISNLMYLTMIDVIGVIMSLLGLHSRAQTCYIGWAFCTYLLTRLYLVLRGVSAYGGRERGGLRRVLCCRRGGRAFYYLYSDYHDANCNNFSNVNASGDANHRDQYRLPRSTRNDDTYDRPQPLKLRRRHRHMPCDRRPS